MSSSTGEKPTNPKDVIGSSKMPLHLWPTTASMYGTLGLLEGALKYGRSNFRAMGIRASIYYDAIRRHCDEWFEGIENDPDSGLHHISHILACAAIIADAMAMGNMNDDRAYPVPDYRGLKTELTSHVARLQQKYADKNPKHYTILDAKGEPILVSPTTNVDWVDPPKADSDCKNCGCWDIRHDVDTGRCRHCDFACSGYEPKVSAAGLVPPKEWTARHG